MYQTTILITWKFPVPRQRNQQCFSLAIRLQVTVKLGAPVATPNTVTSVCTQFHLIVTIRCKKYLVNMQIYSHIITTSRHFYETADVIHNQCSSFCTNYSRLKLLKMINLIITGMGNPLIAEGDEKNISTYNSTKNFKW